MPIQAQMLVNAESRWVNVAPSSVPFQSVEEGDNVTYIFGESIEVLLKVGEIYKLRVICARGRRTPVVLAKLIGIGYERINFGESSKTTLYFRRAGLCPNP